jgi:putative methanogenesis marker 13 metalloprotein
MYMLRDLGVEVIVIHGPAGCNFRAARLLEHDNVRVVTSSLDQSSVIFGGERVLIEVLEEVGRRFSPSLVGIVGTCCAAIIGEDVEKAVTQARLPFKAIVVNCDPYNPENVTGAISALEAAADARIITPDEVLRQKSLLIAANKNERTFGTASKPYLGTYPGDDRITAAVQIIRSIEQENPIAIVLNAKKETSLLYADIPCAIYEAVEKLDSSAHIFCVANIDDTVGLPRVRRHAATVWQAFEDQGVRVDHVTGGPDEYATTGPLAAELVKAENERWGSVVICGLPHSVPLWGLPHTISVATGSRALYALRELGYGTVLDEERAHHSVLGSSGVVESMFGRALRSQVMR